MVAQQSLSELSTDQLREMVEALLRTAAAKDEQVTRQSTEIRHKQALIDKLTHENALLKRLKFAAQSERYSAEQRSLLDETLDADLQAVSDEIEQLTSAAAAPREKQQPRRQPLPANLPRREIHHEPESTTCGCGCRMKRIGEDVSEKLDYQPGVFTVERHIRGKWVCTQCETLIQAPVPAQVIDKGIPTAGLLAQVMTAKYADHLPLYRKEQIFGRAGLAIPRSTLASWVGACGVQLQPLVDALREVVLEHNVVHVDETPVQMLAPGEKKTHRAYVWGYATTPFAEISAVVYDFSPGRSGEYARNFLGDWKGKLVCDDYGGYKASFALGVTEIGCMTHARRKFYDLHITNKSVLAEQALRYIAALYEVESEVRDSEPDVRRRIRQERAAPLMDAFHAWMIAQRELVHEGLGITKALDYSLKRWAALSRYLHDGTMPIDNNHIEQQIRPWALGRKNWLFAGSLRSGQRAAALMSLIQSAKLNGHDAYAYLKDVLTRLPTQRASEIGELLPHRWQPS